MDILGKEDKIRTQKKLEDIYQECSTVTNAVSRLQGRMDEFQAKILELGERILQMEGGIKAFLNMQSMIGQEHINILELLIAKIGIVEKNFAEKLTPEHPKKESTVTPVKPPILPHEFKIEDSSLGYSMQTMVNRQKFLHIQKYLAEDKATGRGKLLGEFPLTMLYYRGEVFSFHMPSGKQDIAEFQNFIQDFRNHDLEQQSVEDLVSRFADLIQQRNQYLAGLAQVLGKLTKKQLIERICLNAPPLIETKEDGYFGEGVFYFIIRNWPKSGEQGLMFQFAEESVPYKKENPLISILGLVQRAQKICAITDSSSTERVLP